MSLYDGIEVETAPMPDMAPQEDSPVQGTPSEILSVTISSASISLLVV